MYSVDSDPTPSEQLCDVQLYVCTCPLLKNMLFADDEARTVQYHVHVQYVTRYILGMPPSSLYFDEKTERNLLPSVYVRYRSTER